MRHSKRWRTSTARKRSQRMSSGCIVPYAGKRGTVWYAKLCLQEQFGG